MQTLSNPRNLITLASALIIATGFSACATATKQQSANSVSLVENSVNLSICLGAPEIFQIPFSNPPTKVIRCPEAVWNSAPSASSANAKVNFYIGSNPSGTNGNTPLYTYGVNPQTYHLIRSVSRTNPFAQQFGQDCFNFPSVATGTRYIVAEIVAASPDKDTNLVNNVTSVPITFP